MNFTMRWAFVLLILCLPTAKAQTTADAVSAILPAQLGIIVIAGQWLFDTELQKVVYKVRVQSNGRDEAEARLNGYKLAVEHAVGSLIVSETQVRNREVISKDILQHSAGYVDRFTVLSTTPTSVTMDVYVAESRIATHILSKTESLKIDGPQVNAQIQTFTAQLQSGEAVLNKVMGNYPHRAYRIKNQQVFFSVDTDREPILLVDFELRLDWDFFRSLNETLASFNETLPYRYTGTFYRFKGYMKAPGDFAAGHKWESKFRDGSKYELLREQLTVMPYVKVTMLRSDGSTVHTDCRRLPQTSFFKFSSYKDTYGLELNGNNFEHLEVKVSLKNVYIQDIQRYKLEILNSCK